MPYEKVIKKMIEEGDNIFDIAKLFGGIKKLLSLVKSDKSFESVLKYKLGGSLTCVVDLNQDNWKLNRKNVKFQLNFITLDLELIDSDDWQPYNALVDIVIPELTDLNQMKILYFWLDEYLMDFGAESGEFNDEKINGKMVWIYVKSINGNKFKGELKVTDEMVFNIIPEKYKI